MVDSGNTYGERVSRLVGWGHWFAFFNIIAAMLVGTRYISQSPWPETLLGQFYLAVSWVGHFGFLVFALYLLVLFADIYCPIAETVPTDRGLFRDARTDVTADRYSGLSNHQPPLDTCRVGSVVQR